MPSGLPETHRARILRQVPGLPSPWFSEETPSAANRPASCADHGGCRAGEQAPGLFAARPPAPEDHRGPEAVRLILGTCPHWCVTWGVGDFPPAHPTQAGRPGAHVLGRPYWALCPDRESSRRPFRARTMPNPWSHPGGAGVFQTKSLFRTGSGEGTQLLRGHLPGPASAPKERPSGCCLRGRGCVGPGTAGAPGSGTGSTRPPWPSWPRTPGPARGSAVGATGRGQAPGLLFHGVRRGRGGQPGPDSRSFTCQQIGSVPAR